MVAIILAAGTGSRMKAEKNKVFLPLCGKEMLLHTVEAFEKSEFVDSIVIVTGRSDEDKCRELLGIRKKSISIVRGGNTRQESSYLGVTEAKSEFVMIHDAARALVTVEDIDAVAKSAQEYGAAAVGTPCIDTMKLCRGGYIVSTVERENLYKIYTPQCFRRDRLLKLHKSAQDENVFVTDDCALYEWGGEKIKIVSGNPLNIKLTTPEDIYVAEAILRQRKTQN